MMRAGIGRDELGLVSEAGRLGDLYRRHAGDATRLAYLVTGDLALAEDLVQEAFVRLYGRFRDLRNPDAFEFYLRRTVVNLARSQFRHRRVERAYLAGPEPDRPTAEAAGADLGTRDELWTALQALSDRQRIAIVLRFYEDLSEARTAEVMGCPVGTVKSLVSRGLDRLRERISAANEGE
ncbi:MAG: SigE family RNA polymerase sigma factor [Actinomycetota bacterium]